MFTICVKFKTKTLSISEIYGYENEIMKGFFLITGSGRLNFRWGKLYLIFQRELKKMAYVLIGKKKIENYDFFTTSGDDRK